MSTVEGMIENKNRKPHTARLQLTQEFTENVVTLDPSKATPFVKPNVSKPKTSRIPRIASTSTPRSIVKTTVVPKEIVTTSSAPRLISKFAGGKGWQNDDIMIVSCNIYGLTISGKDLTKAVIHILKNSDHSVAPTAENISSMKNIIATVTITSDVPKTFVKTILPQEDLVVAESVKITWTSYPECPNSLHRDDAVCIYSEDLTNAEIHLYVI